MSHPPFSEIKEEIEKLSSYIETAQRLIYQGGVVDVSSLQGKIERLCSIVEKLPPVQGRDILPLIENLLTAIDQLENDINLQHDAVTDKLQRNDAFASPLMAQEVIEEDDKD